MSDAAPNVRRWWNLKTAAAHLEVHPNTLKVRAQKAVRKYATTRSGLPVVRFSKRGPFRFPIDAFKAWAEHPTE